MTNGPLDPVVSCLEGIELERMGRGDLLTFSRRSIDFMRSVAVMVGTQTQVIRSVGNLIAEQKYGDAASLCAFAVEQAEKAGSVFAGTAADSERLNGPLGENVVRMRPRPGGRPAKS